MFGWQNFYAGKSIVVTGCCGTVGSKLVAQLLALNAARITGIDNAEEQLFYQQAEYKDEPRFAGKYTDIKSLPAVVRAFRGADIVFHAAALKHVPICEQVPDAAIETNITGVQNIIQAAVANKVERVLFTSTDKAVNPTNVMGMSKLMGERLMTAANVDFDTIFASTRFGNVAGSKGSVIPLFHRQIQTGGPVTLTSEMMTRFLMTIQEASNLVLESCAIATGGEVFVTKMPVISIRVLAEVMKARLAPVYGQMADDIEIRVTGARAGEKEFEELTTCEETSRTRECDRLLIVTPNTAQAMAYAASSPISPMEYNSANLPQMNVAALNRLLDQINLPGGAPDTYAFPGPPQNGESVVRSLRLLDQPECEAAKR